ncbi:hypothetical protein [Terriglobus saanensis]|uniref:hypothetical protein n=1 Tax=Terriglobus saanensis TaxID=870903 RepID=UPI00165147F8|nr:hypothetical protein [Terriglobus saanensis]
MGVMFSSDRGDMKKGDPNLLCFNRYEAEKNRCFVKYDGGGRFGINRPKGACLDRAFYRYEACINGTPDPGPPMASLDGPAAKDKQFVDIFVSLKTIALDLGADKRSVQ